MTTQTQEKIHLGQIEPIRFSDLIETPTTLAGYGITDAYTKTESDARFVRFDNPQGLTPEQQAQARDNIGISYPSPVHNHWIGDGITPRFSFGVGESVHFVNGNNTTVVFNPTTKSISINAPNPTTGYTHPTHTPINITLSGKQVFSNIQVDGLGHFVGYGTRSDLPYVDFTSNERITGLKTFARYGNNTGTTIGEVLGFHLEPASDHLHRMMIRNTQNELSPAGEVNWFFTMRENYQSTGVDFDRIGFHRGGSVILGGRLPSQALSTEMATHSFNSIAKTPFQISTVVKRSLMVEDRIYAGKDNLSSTLFLSSSDKIFSSGKIYAQLGLRTTSPTNYNDVNYSTWLLGKAFESTNDSVTRYIEVNIDGVVYELLARQKGGTPPGPPVDPEVESTDLDWQFTNGDGVSGSFTINYVEGGVSKVLTTTTTPSNGTITVDENTYVRIKVTNSDPMSPNPGPAILLQVETTAPSSSTVYYRNSPPVSEETYDLYVLSNTSYKVTAFISEEDEV